jgi:hypothetical protein
MRGFVALSWALARASTREFFISGGDQRHGHAAPRAELEEVLAARVFKARQVGTNESRLRAPCLHVCAGALLSPPERFQFREMGLVAEPDLDKALGEYEDRTFGGGGHVWNPLVVTASSRIRDYDPL